MGVLQARDSNECPVRRIAGVSFMYIREGDIYLVLATKANAHAAMAFSFLHQLGSVLVSYFGALCEESIRNNFVLIYELLDEVMDYGFPQVLAPELLKLYITQAG